MECCEPAQNILDVDFNTNMLTPVGLGQRALRLAYVDFGMFFSLPQFIVSSFLQSNLESMQAIQADHIATFQLSL